MSRNLSALTRSRFRKLASVAEEVLTAPDSRPFRQRIRLTVREAGELGALRSALLRIGFDVLFVRCSAGKRGSYYSPLFGSCAPEIRLCSDSEALGFIEAVETEAEAEFKLAQAVQAEAPAAPAEAEAPALSSEEFVTLCQAIETAARGLFLSPAPAPETSSPSFSEASRETEELLSWVSAEEAREARAESEAEEELLSAEEEGFSDYTETEAELLFSPLNIGNLFPAVSEEALPALSAWLRKENSWLEAEGRPSALPASSAWLRAETSAE
jgi:hypothetical protein